MFSENVDDFTHFGMSEQEALVFGTDEWGSEAARLKLEAAIDDRPLLAADFVSDGLGRWRAALDDIAFQHGIDHLRSTLAEIGFQDWPIHANAVRRSAARDELLALDGSDVGADFAFGG